MVRAALIALLLLLQSCASANKAFVLPETAPGGWRLTQTKHEGSKTLGVYDGAGLVHVEAEDMGVQAVAFERVQRTRSQPDTIFFDKGNYFVTVRWEKADRDALRQLVRELQKK